MFTVLDKFNNKFPSLGKIRGRSEKFSTQSSPCYLVWNQQHWTMGRIGRVFQEFLRVRTRAGVRARLKIRTRPGARARAYACTRARNTHTRVRGVRARGKNLPIVPKVQLSGGSTVDDHKTILQNLPIVPAYISGRVRVDPLAHPITPTNSISFEGKQ